MARKKHTLIPEISIRNCGLNILLGLYSPVDWHRVIFNWSILDFYEPGNIFYDVDRFIETYGNHAIKPRVDVDRIPDALVAELTYIVLMKRWELKGKVPTKREITILINECSPVRCGQEIKDFISFHLK